MEVQPLVKKSKDLMSPFGRWLPVINQDLSVTASCGEIGRTWEELCAEARDLRDRDAQAAAERAVAAVGVFGSATRKPAVALPRGWIPAPGLGAHYLNPRIQWNLAPGLAWPKE